MRHHSERHRTDRIGWLRATVLGANDGIVSTASLVLGVAAASASHHDIVLTGVARYVPLHDGWQRSTIRFQSDKRTPCAS